MNKRLQKLERRNKEAILILIRKYNPLFICSGFYGPTLHGAWTGGARCSSYFTPIPSTAWHGTRPAYLTRPNSHSTKR